MPWSRVNKAGKQGETWETTRGGGPGLKLLRYAGHPERDVPTTRPPHSWRPFFGPQYWVFKESYQGERHNPRTRHADMIHKPGTLLSRTLIFLLLGPCIRLGKQTQWNQGTALE
ncbi:hypothetical protein PCANC_22044 [Puccinia coronata f. sp. avenae]|uniref:Uncharacterized protein n=1 Tax=Puccinia coronata f. sp. avenae TaxID=200324 RepID=A0A2N5TNJ5_9BASI|nr:hypothetical protein PCANC_22044 [Puccinia coronata f. sp. avenae]